MTHVTGGDYGVFDMPYGARFQAFLSPAWLDHVALLNGVSPPARRGRPFRWCDLGCGSGLSAAIFAATHPHGRFVGLDANPEHIAIAERLARDAGLSNIAFSVADLTQTVPADGPFDYIVSHGVYSWAGEVVRTGIRAFIDRHLAAGGLAFVSYNAMPGRSRDVPFQRVVSELGRTLSDASEIGFHAAMRTVQLLAAGGVPALADSKALADITASPDAFPAAYLVHEFMVSAWQPLWSIDVRRDMARIGLTPVGSTRLMDNHEEFVLNDKGRDLLGDIADPDARELVKDCLRDTHFRSDVFSRAGQTIGAGRRRRRLLDSCFALTMPASQVTYVLETPAGRLDYDNQAARAVAASLDGGPATLSEISAQTDLTTDDVLRVAGVMAVAGSLRPVECATGPATSAINAAIRARPEATDNVVLPCGTALAIEQVRSPELADEDRAALKAFLRRYGAGGAFDPPSRAA